MRWVGWRLKVAGRGDLETLVIVPILRDPHHVILDVEKTARALRSTVAESGPPKGGGIRPGTLN